MDAEGLNRVTRDVVQAALAVHSQYGPGLLERPYQLLLAKRLRERNHVVQCEVAVPLVEDGLRIDSALRLDLLVDDLVVVEVKCVADLAPVHFAQLTTYLRVGSYPVGLLLNFRVARMRDGIHRIAGPSLRAMSKRPEDKSVDPPL